MKGVTMEKIKLDSGYITGMEYKEKGLEATIYRGIPYAAPPVGKLRWQPPQPVAPWSEVRECTRYSLQPAQRPDPNLSEAAKKVPSSEDCLYLNVVAPTKKSDEKLPVMVWFHGGGVRYGSANWDFYNSVPLASHGVVLVSVNTRLGIFGLFAHPSLSKESPTGTCGNYMLMDMIASLQWVKRNISAFGGDPDNVTIFGESGGGVKVVALLASPNAKGLFHRAICESGGANPEETPVKKLEEYGEQLFEKLGVNKEKDPLAAARAIPWEKLVEVDQAMNENFGPWVSFMGVWTLAVDGYFLPDVAHKIFEAGKQNPVPLMLICNLGELTGPGFVTMPQMIPGYVKLLSGAKTAGVKGFAGIFDQLPGNWRAEGAVTAHAMEMHSVFGQVDNVPGWQMLYFLYKLAGAKSPLPVITDAERKVSEYMMQMWTQFARTGNPSVKGLIYWPPWEPFTDKYLYIAEPLQVKLGYSKVAQK
jgi:para-nitrobenzyl esterase